MNSLNLIKNTVKWENSCLEPTLYSPLIQFFPNFISILDELKNNFLRTSKEMPSILYQLYFSLERLKDEFTHYDFHAGNAGFYKPFENKYIVMSYHLENGSVISFPTIYIAKIIDYGRCYTKDTKIIADYICRIKVCRPNCGFHKGFGVINGFPNETANERTSSFYWINPRVVNRSHDLRLIANFSKLFKSSFPFFNDIKYLNTFGTPEDLNTYSKVNKIIRNVSDVRSSLEDFLPEWCRNELNEQYYISQGMTKAGDIHIYADNTPYEFIVNL